jgi:hypothetical protein
MTRAGESLLSPDTVADARAVIARLVGGLRSVILGKEETIDEVVAALLARGHILLEGLPGLGKTELVKALSRLLSLDFRRIQFTPDLLPTDITGSHILQDREGRKELVFHPGPVFTNLLLADEINRASPKTQAALLEAMQERRVTTFGETRRALTTLMTRPFSTKAKSSIIPPSDSTTCARIPAGACTKCSSRMAGTSSCKALTNALLLADRHISPNPIRQCLAANLRKPE